MYILIILYSLSVKFRFNRLLRISNWIDFIYLFFLRINLDIVDSFGWDLGNGSFSGLTGKLQREECDFGGIGSFIRPDRMMVIDYTVGTFYRQ